MMKFLRKHSKMLFSYDLVRPGAPRAGARAAGRLQLLAPPGPSAEKAKQPHRFQTLIDMTYHDIKSQTPPTPSLWAFDTLM